MLLWICKICPPMGNPLHAVTILDNFIYLFFYFTLPSYTFTSSYSTVARTWKSVDVLL